MFKKQIYIKKKRISPLLGGDLGVGLVVFLFLQFATNLSAQEVIYSGLDNPTSIYATQDHLFVVESGKHRILKLDHNGKLLETLGGLGSGDYQFDTPIDIDATNGLKIYISDYRNNRVQIFDRRFQYLSTIRAPQGQRSFRPTQLIVNDFGELFVYDESSKSIHRYDENGNFIDSYKVPSGLEVGKIGLREDQLALIDWKNNKVQFMSQNGLLGEEFPFQVAHIQLLDYMNLDNLSFELDVDSIIKGVNRDQ
ncbi:MAG: hypothetical protein ED557_14200 [Balneola sp.]|nr:MAG: hypothetical protein ED557_14200 [Balneola sp.]